MTRTIEKQNRNGLMLNNLFDNLFNDDLLGVELFPNNSISLPQYDILDKENEYIVDFMLPGFKKNDVSINIDDNAITIEGERKVNKDVKYSHKGSFYGKFNKSFTLPEEILGDKINASFENGILSIQIPKRGESKINKKSININ